MDLDKDELLATQKNKTIENKIKVLIANIGCDDITYTELELNEQELKTIKKFAIENNKNSGCQCQPSIAIYTKYTVDKSGYYQAYDDDDITLEVEK